MKLKRKWKYSVGFGSFIITLLLFMTILFPLFNKQNIVKAIYGSMPATVYNSYEWNGNLGKFMLNMLRLGTSEYYLQVYQGPIDDGWANTTRIWDNNGTIQRTTIDSLDFATYATYISLCHVYGDIYAVCYDSGSDKMTIKTFSADDADGSIGAAVIDTLTGAWGGTYQPELIQVSGNMFAMIYRNLTGTGGGLQSVYISNSGSMAATVNDTVWYNTTADTDTAHSAVAIDSNTIAIAYTGGGTDGYICTYNISASTGDITNTRADVWEFDTTQGYYVDLYKVKNNVFVLAYSDTADDGWVKTLTISDTGAITKAFIDTLEFANTNTISYNTLFPVNDASIAKDNNGVYGVTCKDSAGDGWIYTMNISSDGSIGASVIDSLEFDVADCIYKAPIAWVNRSWYYISYTSTGNDGWGTVVNITTNWATPVFSTPQPTNGTTGVHIQPRCNITIADQNADLMTLSWFSNTTGSWVHYQTNSSCANGTYRWASPFASYSTKYWWKVYANDTLHNSTAWYYFTTEEEPVSETWQTIVGTAYNGSIKNLTYWRGFSTSINGSIKNLTSFKAISTSINGSIKNITRWNSISTAMNGSIKNMTIWRTFNTDINGSIKNITAKGWTIIDSSLNGSIKNLTSYKVVSDSINGSIKNITSGMIISDTINGSIKNLTMFTAFSTSINGSIKNITVMSWHILDSSLNGSIRNITFMRIVSDSINGSIRNISIEPASPFNIHLFIYNPNPGNGTHGKNYLKKDTTGLTTSVDLWYQNFTTPTALLPGTYSVTINSTLFTNTPSTWNTSTVYAWVWNNNTGGIAPSGPLYVGQQKSGADYTIFRSFLRFDTSIIPDEAVITSAYVKLIVWQDFSTTDFNVTLLSTKPPKPHNPLIPTDYGRSGIGTVSLGQENTTGYANDDMFNITLKPVGLTIIDKTFYTNFSVRSHKDQNQTAPTGNEWITFYGNAMPIANYPKLIVNYTIPSSNWQHHVNLTFYSNSSGPWLPYAHSYVNSNGTVTVPALNFSGVSRYWWNCSWNSNHTNYGNSSIWWFETVNTGTGSGGVIIMSPDGLTSSPVLWGFGGLIIGCSSVLGILVFRRRRDEE
jgi:hypothetical protein